MNDGREIEEKESNDTTADQTDAQKWLLSRGKRRTEMIWSTDERPVGGGFILVRLQQAPD